jgi:hypothetical protein
MKFGLDQKFEFKKSFEFYLKTFVRVATKVAANFVQFSWHGMAWHGMAYPILVGHLTYAPL